MRQIYVDATAFILYRELIYRKVWTCPKPVAHKCNFFLWVDDEKEAKEWHTKHGPPPPPAPETPKAIEKVSEEAPKDLGNPWTKSITKRKPKSREVSDEDETARPSDRNVEAAELSDFEDADPSRKAANHKVCHPRSDR
jgi:hypothetical protein